MANTDFAVTIHGINALQRKMLGRHDRLKKMRTAHKAAADFIIGWVGRNFDEQGRKSMGGSGWKKLASRTIEAKKRGWGEYKKTPTPRILVNIGTLRGRWKVHYSAWQVIVESGVEYSYYHEHGKGVPKRVILPRPDQVARDLEKIYQYFADRANR